MNEFGGEKSESRDLVSEELKYHMEIDLINLDDFPQVTEEDIATGKEKYVALIGTWDSNGEKADLRIEGTINCDEPPYIFHKPEGHGFQVDIAEIQKFLEEGKLQHPEVSNASILGEVHTHPYEKWEDLGGRDPWLPSVKDIESITKNYEAGIMPSDKPFVFGISTRKKDGTPVLAFYRIVRDSDGKLVPRAFNDWGWVEGK